MVKVQVGLQVTMMGAASDEAIAQWGLALQSTMQHAGVTVDVELYDEHEGNTLLRAWVAGTPYQIETVAELAQVASCGSAMFVQLQDATDAQVASAQHACTAHNIDADLGDGGIGYPHTAQQLRVLMGALRR